MDWHGIMLGALYAAAVWLALACFAVAAVLFIRNREIRKRR